MQSIAQTLVRQDHPSIDEARLWDTIHTLAGIGATVRGGVCRLAFSAVDKAGRDAFTGWCGDAGMIVSTDPIGNLFALRPGRDEAAPVVMIGSHIDSQPTGGKYDGAYGVMAGLEVIRALDDANITTRYGIELVAWANEEGARFQPALMGSSVFTGALPLADALAARDGDGSVVADEIAAHGIVEGLAARPARPIAAYLEIHIEQGPVLEDAAVRLGVVGGIQAIRWYEIDIVGNEAHAGPTPMPLRRDALMGAADLALAIERIAQHHGPHGRGTVGTLTPYPASRNVIPGRVRMTADLRHPDDAVIAEMDGQLREAVRTIGAIRGLTIELAETWRAPAAPFDAAVTERFRVRARERLGREPLTIVSGAGHDAQRIAAVAPAGMLFIPCKDGISHNEAEAIDRDDAALGCAVLLDVAADLAEIVPVA